MSSESGFNSDMFADSASDSASGHEEWMQKADAAEKYFREEDELKAKEKTVQEIRGRQRQTFSGEVVLGGEQRAREQRRRMVKDSMVAHQDLLGDLAAMTDSESSSESAPEDDLMGAAPGDAPIAHSRRRKDSLDEMLPRTQREFDVYAAAATARLGEIAATDEDGTLFFGMLKKIVVEVLRKSCYPEDAKEMGAACYELARNMVEEEKRRRHKKKKVRRAKPQIVIKRGAAAEDVALDDFENFL